jgi:hypothetical protein
MEKIRILIIIAISGLMVLTLSGMAGAIGFTYTDETSNAAIIGGSPIIYTVTIPEDGAGEGTLTVTGGDENSDSAWTLNWVAFKLGGVKLNGNPSFFTVDQEDEKFGDISWTFDVTVSGYDPEKDNVWSLQANFSGYVPENEKLITNQISVTTPEPSTLLLLGSGLTLIGLWGFRRKFKK